MIAFFTYLTKKNEHTLLPKLKENKHNIALLEGVQSGMALRKNLAIHSKNIYSFAYLTQHFHRYTSKKNTYQLCSRLSFAGLFVIAED